MQIATIYHLCPCLQKWSIATDVIAYAVQIFEVERICNSKNWVDYENIRILPVQRLFQIHHKSIVPKLKTRERDQSCHRAPTRHQLPNRHPPRFDKLTRARSHGSPSLGSSAQGSKSFAHTSRSLFVMVIDLYETVRKETITARQQRYAQYA